MKVLSKTQHKNIRAQAMVEFMLALPLLVVLIYGTIEVARLVFIFSSVANASRQAARYGSGAGEIDNVAFYQNCDGIREVANRSAYIIPFDQINITYDRGVNQNGAQIPISNVNPSPESNTCPIKDGVIRNGDRIIVEVSANYEPILSIIPIEPIKIVSASARTFLISIPILGSSMPRGFSAETSTPSRIPTSTLSTDTPTIFPTITSTNIPSSGKTPPYATPSLAQPPTLTFTPSKTSLPTSTASITPTPISCQGLTGVSHAPLTISGNIMEMSITNNSGHTLSTAQIYLEWNHDTGHKSGADHTLRLRQVLLASQIWNGDIQTPSAYITSFHPFIPTGESTIRFIFNQSYDLADGTERIIINISTPGCTNYPVDSRN
jgi:hypothetical protein